MRKTAFVPESVKAGVLATLIGLVSTGGALAAEFTLRLNEFGSTHPNCAEAIEAVAQAFSEAAGVPILGAGCGDSAVMRAPDGLISYAAAQRVATFDTDAKEGFGVDGFFSSLAACQAGLEAERAILFEETGLTPFSAYCYRGNSVSAPRFRARLDAVGNPARKKFESSATLWSENSAPQQATAAVVGLLESSGARVVSTTVEPDVGGWRVAASWYGERDYWFTSDDVLAFDSAASCASVADSLSTGWGSDIVDVAPTAFICGTPSRTSGSTLLMSISLSLEPSVTRYRMSILPTNYPTEAACTADLSRVADQINSAGGGFIANACGKASDARSGAWRMALWTKLP